MDWCRNFKGIVLGMALMMLPVWLSLPAMGQQESSSQTESGTLPNEIVPLKSRLNLTVKGIKRLTGTIQIQLFDSANEFEKSDGIPKESAVETAKYHSVVQIFEGLEPGIYAIKVFHDMNGNGELDTNFLGLPTEPRGFSNNVQTKTESVSFEKAKFEIGDSELTMEIKIH